MVLKYLIYIANMKPFILNYRCEATRFKLQIKLPNLIPPKKRREKSKTKKRKSLENKYNTLVRKYDALRKAKSIEEQRREDSNQEQVDAPVRNADAHERKAYCHHDYYVRLLSTNIRTLNDADFIGGFHLCRQPYQYFLVFPILLAMLIHLPVFKYFVLSARTVRKAASEASGRRAR